MAKKETLADKAKKAGLPVQVVYNRKHAGWSEKKALSVPLREYKKKSILAENTSEKVAYKVEPSEVQTPAKAVSTSTPKPTIKPVERKVPPTVPLPVEKYEAPKDKTFLYVAVVCAVLLAFALTTT
jgi:hypothetical protein